MDSFTPDGGFGLSTCDFNVLDVLMGGSRSRKSTSYLSIRPIPFGGSAVIQSGGVGPRTISLKVYADAANCANLENARGYHGSLVCWEGTFACTLQDSDSSLLYLGDSAGATKPQELTVTWILDT